jgi:hypothetical protein
MRTAQTAPEISAKSFNGMTILFITSNSAMDVNSWVSSLVVSENELGCMTAARNSKFEKKVDLFRAQEEDVR